MFDRVLNIPLSSIIQYTWFFNRTIPVYKQVALRKKCPYSELFWSVFPGFGLNTERYEVFLRIQSECGKIRTRITPNTDTFLRSVTLRV